MINHEYLEKYCIAEINKAGKILRDDSINLDIRYGQEFRLDAFSEVLQIIAREVSARSDEK